MLHAKSWNQYSWPARQAGEIVRQARTVLARGSLRVHRVVAMRIPGQRCGNYGVNYREAQLAIAAEVPETFDARTRAYLLLKHHGQEICKRTKPKCEECPVNSNCAFFASHRRRPLEA